MRSLYCGGEAMVFFALDRVRTGPAQKALPENNLQDKQTIRTETNKQTLPRHCTHGIHIHYSILKPVECQQTP